MRLLIHDIHKNTQKLRNSFTLPLCHGHLIFVWPPFLTLHIMEKRDLPTFIVLGIFILPKSLLQPGVPLFSLLVDAINGWPYQVIWLCNLSGYLHNVQAFYKLILLTINKKFF